MLLTSLMYIKNCRYYVFSVIHCRSTKLSNSLYLNMITLLCLNVGDVTIPGEINFQLNSELNASTPVFTLTCTSTGGPATTVSWTRNGTVLSDISQIVTNTQTGTYENTLRVAMRGVGTYVCDVSNSRSSDNRSLTVVGKNQRNHVYLL